MKIKYSGITDNKTRCAIITYKNGKEETTAEKVIETIEKSGYKVNLINCDETTEIYIKVFDKEEYDNIKDIYLAAKAKCK